MDLSCAVSVLVLKYPRMMRSGVTLGPDPDHIANTQERKSLKRLEKIGASRAHKAPSGFKEDHLQIVLVYDSPKTFSAYASSCTADSCLHSKRS